MGSTLSQTAGSTLSQTAGTTLSQTAGSTLSQTVDSKTSLRHENSQRPLIGGDRIARPSPCIYP